MYNDEKNLTDAQLLRMKAEEKVKEKQVKSDKVSTENDVKKLLHELQVHQIELEMQNEELIEANDTAEKALKKFTMLYDFAPMGYFSLDADGGIEELNFTGADMLGHKRFSLINANFKLFVAESSLPEFNKFFKKVFTGENKECCELMLGYNNTPLATVYMEGIVVGDDHRCLLSVFDITDFKKRKTP